MTHKTTVSFFFSDSHLLSMPIWDRESILRISQRLPSEMEEDFEICIKLVIVGNGAVGKSSMIQRYCKGIFTKDYKKTIGVDFLEREIE